MEVLNRLRKIAPLSAEQTNDWDYFTTTWDKEMAEALGEDWPECFSQHVQHILEELQGGNAGALSQFMHQETQRVLGDVEVLRLPGKVCKPGGGAG